MAVIKNFKKKNKAIELLKEGKKVGAIATLLKSKETTVRDWVKDLPEYESNKYRRTNKSVLKRQKDKVLKLYLEGLFNKNELARQTGASVGNVRVWVKKAFPMFDPKAAQKKAIKEMYCTGRYSAIEIAAYFNLNARKVRRWIRETVGTGSIKRKLIYRLHTGSPFTVEEISTLIGCERTTVNRYIKEKREKDVLKTYQ